MNAITKTITPALNEKFFASEYQYSLPKLQKSIVMIFFVLALIFFSALSVVYVQAENRLLFANLSKLQKVRDDLNITYGQLLLEQSAWAAPVRIETIASSRLHMILPKPNEIQLLNY